MDILHTYILITGKEEENRKLRERIGIYEQEKNRYAEAEYENKRLRGLLDLKSTDAVRVSAAEVIARDPTNWFQVLWINKGSNDGIKRDMTAVTPAGIIGRVHNIYGSRSGILLITDVNSSVAVRIQTSRVDGILQGRGGGSLYLKYVQNNSDVRIGDRIITSGLDGLHPEGLLAGYVTSVRSGDEYLFQEIEVEPAQNINTVEEVVILRR
jgi:rod shape-determining protein MreC